MVSGIIVYTRVFGFIFLHIVCFYDVLLIHRLGGPPSPLEKAGVKALPSRCNEVFSLIFEFKIYVILKAR